MTNYAADAFINAMEYHASHCTYGQDWPSNAEFAIAVRKDRRSTGTWANAKVVVSFFTNEEQLNEAVKKLTIERLIDSDVRQAWQTFCWDLGPDLFTQCYHPKELESLADW